MAKRHSAKFRQKMILNCVAPNIMPLTYLEYPLNTITRSKHLKYAEKTVYAALYTLFSFNSKIQYQPQELAKVLNPQANSSAVVTRTIKKLAKMKLLEVISVYDPSNKRRKRPVGYVLKNTGVTKPAVNQKVIQQAKLKRKHEIKITTQKQKKIVQTAKSVIAYFNRKMHKKWQWSTYLSQIKYLLLKGYTKQDLLTAIDKMYQVWPKGTKMHAFVQPSTIFHKTKFDGYLNHVTPQDNANPLTQKTDYEKERKEFGLQ